MHTRAHQQKYTHTHRKPRFSKKIRTKVTHTLTGSLNFQFFATKITDAHAHARTRLKLGDFRWSRWVRNRGAAVEDLYKNFKHIYTIVFSIQFFHTWMTHVQQHSPMVFCCCDLLQCVATGWPRLIGSPKLQIILHKRATKYRLLLRKMTYEDKGSYESSPTCIKLLLCCYVVVMFYL